MEKFVMEPPKQPPPSSDNLGAVVSTCLTIRIPQVPDNGVKKLYCTYTEELSTSVCSPAAKIVRHS